MVHVSEGERTYIKDIDEFGDVTRSGFLGLTSGGAVVECDDGIMRAYCGTDYPSQLVNKTSGKDGHDVDQTVPTDVKTVGVEILTAEGLDEKSQQSLFQKFMVMSSEQRREKVDGWVANKDNASNKSAFISEILSLLDDDSPFIATQSAKLLSHLDQSVRDAMLTKLQTITSVDNRKDLIIGFTKVKNDRKKTEIFLQDLYLLLMEDDMYLRMEFERFGKQYFDTETLEAKIVSFLSTASDTYKSKVIDNWRTRHLYNSKNSGPRYVRNILRRF